MTATQNAHQIAPKSPQNAPKAPASTKHCPVTAAPRRALSCTPPVCAPPPVVAAVCARTAPAPPVSLQVLRLPPLATASAAPFLPPWTRFDQPKPSGDPAEDERHRSAPPDGRALPSSLAGPVPAQTLVLRLRSTGRRAALSACLFGVLRVLCLLCFLLLPSSTSALRPLWARSCLVPCARTP